MRALFYWLFYGLTVCPVSADKTRGCFYKTFWDISDFCFMVVPDDKLVEYERKLSFTRPLSESQAKERAESVATGIRELCAEECLFALGLLVREEMSKEISKNGYRKETFALEENGPSLDSVRAMVIFKNLIDNWEETACMFALQLLGQRRGTSVEVMPALSPEKLREVRLIVKQSKYGVGFLSAVKVRLEELGSSVVVTTLENLPSGLSSREQDAVRNLFFQAAYLKNFRRALKEQMEFFGIDADKALMATVRRCWFGDGAEAHPSLNFLR